MNRIPSVLKLHFRDKATWFIIPYAVLASSFLVNLLVGYISKEEITTGGILSIYVYLFVMGITVLPQTFNFALSFSIRRHDYFTGTALFAAANSLFISVILLVLGMIEKATAGWGTQLHFFSLPYLNEGSATQQVFVFFMIIITLFFGGFTIGSIYRKFRGIGMIVMAIAGVALSTVLSFLSTHYNWWKNIFTWFSDKTALDIALWLIPITLIYALVSYLLLRRSTV
ncbi:hypothetical protein [Paenibacillus sp. NPDC058174]|uniref:hypothetical protein n=1 Tax=Paenibacillus sp. NPDC058174 TaxID=3346366 RepID=UPI0036DDEAB7